MTSSPPTCAHPSERCSAVDAPDHDRNLSQNGFSYRFVFLYFLLQSRTILSILLCVVRVFLRTASVVVHIPAPYIFVGDTTLSNCYNRSLNEYFRMVTSCWWWVNTAQAHFVRQCIPTWPWSWNVMVRPRYFIFPVCGSVSIDLCPPPIVLRVYFLSCWFRFRIILVATPLAHQRLTFCTI